ncbi:unnamed protein product, partial [Pylaiella littoralis]
MFCVVYSQSKLRSGVMLCIPPCDDCARSNAKCNFAPRLVLKVRAKCSHCWSLYPLENVKLSYCPRKVKIGHHVEYRKLRSFPPGGGIFFLVEIKPPGGELTY